MSNRGRHKKKFKRNHIEFQKLLDWYCYGNLTAPDFHAMIKKLFHEQRKT